MKRLAEFMRTIAQDTYPEPPSAGHSEITAKMVPQMCERLPKGALVLDVGCGQGVAMEMFFQNGRISKVFGLTLNSADSAILTERELPHAVCAMERLPNCLTGTYDLVWARHVLEHSIAPYFVLHEFKRVLKPGGWLYVEVPAPGTACKHETNKNHYSVLTEFAWGCLITRAGFEVVEALQWNLQTPAGPDIYYSFVCKKPSYTQENPATATAGACATRI